MPNMSEQIKEVFGIPDGVLDEETLAIMAIKQVFNLWLDDFVTARGVARYVYEKWGDRPMQDYGSFG